jgi:hypothetical protein
MSLNFPEISIPALIILSLSGIVILTGKDGRWLALALGVQYLGVFLLVFLAWPLSLAVVKLVAGWMAAALLGIGLVGAPNHIVLEERFSPSGSIFRLLAAFMVGLTMLAVAPRVSSWFQDVGIEIILGSLLLIGLGMLQLGLTARPVRVVLGLLTILGGFEVLYAPLENSKLVAGLLAVLNLGLAMVGAYLVAVSEAGTKQ